MSTIERVRSPLPAEIEEYEGRWVAIRDGEIVADAETLEELVADERTSDTDLIYLVPEPGTYFY
jgi:hypothetical protein